MLLVSFSLRYLKCQNAKNEPSLRYKHFLISHHSFYLCSFLMTVTGILITFNGLEIFFNKGRAKLCRSSPTIFMIRPSLTFTRIKLRKNFLWREKRESSLVNCLKLIIFQQHFCMSTMHLELPISDNTFHISTVTSAILMIYFFKKSIPASTLITKLCSISYLGVNSEETLYFSIFIQ